MRSRNIVSYIELLVNPDANGAATLGKTVPFNKHFEAMQSTLLTHGIQNYVQRVNSQLAHIDNVKNKQLLCNTQHPDSACQIKVNYIYQINRYNPPTQFFAQLLEGFLLAQQDSRVVAINIVGPEENIVSLKDYTLEMHMIGWLHQRYPSVNITLHAGEMKPSDVRPEDLRFHIRQAIDIAHAQRIGHGLDIAHENHAISLLHKMATQHILVETNLTSNALTLGIQGKNHPLPLYLKYHVPVALSTDDEGVLRTDINREFLRAVQTYHLSYPTIKQFARNSLTYSFLPGKSLWKNADNHKPVSICRQDKLGDNKPSHRCEAFLLHNKKAAMQWKLERAFSKFERVWV